MNIISIVALVFFVFGSAQASLASGTEIARMNYFLKSRERQKLRMEELESSRIHPPTAILGPAVRYIHSANKYILGAYIMICAFRISFSSALIAFAIIVLARLLVAFLIPTFLKTYNHKFALIAGTVIPIISFVILTMTTNT